MIGSQESWPTGAPEKSLKCRRRRRLPVGGGICHVQVKVKGPLSDFGAATPRSRGLRERQRPAGQLSDGTSARNEGEKGGSNGNSTGGLVDHFARKVTCSSPWSALEAWNPQIGFP